jgi:hypothetical protein
MTQLAANTIAQMSAAEKAFFMKAMEAGNLEGASEVIKINMQAAVDKETRMAKLLLSNPQRLATFSATVLDMAAA